MPPNIQQSSWLCFLVTCVCICSLADLVLQLQSLFSFLDVRLSEIQVQKDVIFPALLLTSFYSECLLKLIPQ